MAFLFLSQFGTTLLPMSTLPTGTVTFLFTDLEGSALLWETHPDTMRADLARHDALLRAAIQENGGHVFNTGGDAFCAAFTTAETALFAAFAAQRALRSEHWSVPAPGLRARLALHTGEAQERGGDYFGPTLNRTARLMNIAHGGQTLLSQATELLVRDKLPVGASLRDLGSHRLKDLLRPEQVFHLHHPDLPGDFPPLRSLNSFPNNLPQRLDSFIGREQELAQVKRLLTLSRLLTLTGVGGAGKTRLAQQAAAECLDLFPQGIWFVPLEALTEPDLVAQAVAIAVGVREQPGQPLITTLCEGLRTQRTLLVLDNCEHLIAACARLSQTLLQACPHVQMLATSREAMVISGEMTYAVPTLPVSDPSRLSFSGGPHGASEAMRLFADRATQSLPSFALTPENSPIIARICRQLDGIPLAIELAAPRVRMLTPEQISKRLDRRMRLLTGGSRTALPRQQTMQAAIQWSHDLLTEPERFLFRRLSVFCGRMDHGSRRGGLQQRWLGGMGRDGSAVVSRRQVAGPGGRRCGRGTSLSDAGDAARVQPGSGSDFRRTPKAFLPDTAGYFFALAERSEPELRGARQAEWLSRLEAEHDNLRSVLKGAADLETRLRLGVFLHRFWYMRGHLAEGRGWLEDPVRDTSGVSPHILAQALNAVGVLAWFQADNDASLCFQSQALAIYRESNNQEGLARTLINLGILCDEQQDYGGARRHYQEGLSFYRAMKDSDNVARTLINLASHFIQTGDPVSALSCLQESLPLLHTAQDQWPLAIAYYNFGLLARDQKDLPAAWGWLTKSLTIRKALDDPLGIASCLVPLAHTLRAQSDLEGAVILLGATDAVYARLRMPRQGQMARETESLAKALSHEMDAENYAAAWARGTSFDAVTAADYVLQMLHTGNE